MSNHQNEVKLKASIAELVGPLLKRLKLAKELTKELDKQQHPNNSKMQQILDQISKEVVKTKGNLYSRENLDKELTGYFGKIERNIDYWIEHYHRTIEWNERTVSDLEEILKQLENAPKAGTKPLEKAYDSSQKAMINEVGESSNGSYDENRVSKALKCIESLEPRKVRCLYSLGIFPENTELKRRLVIYWWIALGILPFRGDTSRTTEQGELFFSYLVGKHILTPVNIREHNQVIDSCTIKPAIRKQLISAWQRDGYNFSEKWEEGTWHLYGDSRFNMNTLLNLDQRYLDSMYINSKQSYRFRVVQLGRWHCTDTEVRNRVGEAMSDETKSKDHIDVNDTDFLKKMGEKVTYLSLRGISGIEELHESIGKLEELKILDLRACHNLKTLPQKPSVIKKNHSCHLGDLSKLNKLRKLSIRIVIDSSDTEDFRGLKTLDSLLVLTIVWGDNKSISLPTYSFPNNLEKLDIRCYPEVEASKLLNPTELKNLKRLYIRGGKLTEIPYNGLWEVEILRLRYLKKLKTDWNELRSSFKDLKYVEYVGCPELQNFPKDRNSWSKEKDKPSS